MFPNAATSPVGYKELQLLRTCILHLVRFLEVEVVMLPASHLLYSRSNKGTKTASCFAQISLGGTTGQANRVGDHVATVVVF